jgi:hypothetical protein
VRLLTPQSLAAERKLECLANSAVVQNILHVH